MFGSLRASLLIASVAVSAILIAGPVGAQQPSAKAQPHPPRPEAGGEVTYVQLRPHKTSLKPIPCPVKPIFYGTIATNGPGDVKYTWVTSDGKSWPDATLKFTGKGQQNVTEEWQIGEPGKTVKAWIQLKVIDPNEKLSAKDIFTIHCAK